MVLQPDNYLEMQDLYKLGRTWDINLGIQMVIPRPDYSKSQMNEIFRQLEIVWKHIADPGYEYFLRGILYYQIHGKRLLPCYIGNTSLAPLVDPIGDVYPCGIAPWINPTPKGYGNPELVIGNVRDTPLSDIIQSHRTREVLDRLDSENCHWCWCSCSFEPTFRHLQTLSEEEVMKIDRLNNAHQADV